MVDAPLVGPGFEAGPLNGGVSELLDFKRLQREALDPDLAPSWATSARESRTPFLRVHQRGAFDMWMASVV